MKKKIVGLLALVVLVIGAFSLEPFKSIANQEEKQEKQIVAKEQSKNPLFGHSESTTTTGQPMPFELYSESKSCLACHQEAYDEWEVSAHARSAGQDPFYENLEENFAVKEMGTDFTRWCAGCHTPLALNSGKVGANSWKPRQAEQEGSSCVFCHTISEVREGSKGVPHDGSYTSSPDLVQQYPFANSDGIGKKISNALTMMAPETHKKSYSKSFYSSAKYCASCHTEYIPTTGAKSFDTYKEWQESVYSGNDPETKRTCIDCHMAADPADPAKKSPGQSTKFGTQKENVRNHRFVGANQAVPWLYGDTEQFELTEKMLRSAATVEIVNAKLTDSSQLGFQVKVTNVGAGHYLPTGVADLRQMWLDIKVKDNQGKIVFQSGKVAKDGEIDPKATIFNTIIADKDGKPLLNHETWRKVKLLKDERIAPKESKLANYQLTLPEELEGPLKIEAVLRFRAFPQHLADSLIREFVPPGGDKTLPITDMAKDELVYTTKN